MKHELQVNDRLRLKGKNVILRLLQKSDAKDIFDNVNDPEIVKWTLRIPHPYSLDLAVKFIKETQLHAGKKKEYVFGIVPKETGKVVGCVGLSNIDWKNKQAELGYWIGKAYWGKGYMTEAVGIMLHFAFNELKLHRVYAHLFAKNSGSKRVLEKCGFIQEGRGREERLRFNQWHDSLCYGILEQEWRRGGRKNMITICASASFFKEAEVLKRKWDV